MYRAADDIQRKTKQVLEVYAVKTAALQAVLDAFVAGVISSSDAAQNADISALSSRIDAIVSENSLTEPTI
jgi:hypothetical protein